MSENKLYRTKVVVGTGSVFGGVATNVAAYTPGTDLDGNIIFDGNGNIAKLVRLGGVKVGTLGEVVGEVLKAPRTLLADYAKNTSLGLDLVEMIPVELEYYKAIAWFPTHNTRVIG